MNGTRGIWRIAAGAALGRASILAYHRIVEGEPRSPLAVSRRAFAEQLRMLLAAGARPCRLSDIACRPHEAQAARARFFAVTLDDGYAETVTSALPVLEDLGIPATVFLVAGFVGQAHPFPWEEERPSAREPGRSLDWAGASRLAACGHEIGSHTLRHAELTRLDGDDLEREIAGSRIHLAAHLDGVEISSFCYPRGDLDRRVVREVARAGYSRAVVTPPRAGIADTSLSLHRIGVYAGDDLLRFRLKTSALFPAARRAALRWGVRGRSAQAPRKAAA